MGEEKYRKDVEKLFEKSPVVNYNSIERIIKNKKKSSKYAKKLIHYLLLKNKIKRLSKGYYTIMNEISLVVFAFEPSYLGLQDALSFHNLWEQETVPIIITTRKARPGIRKVLNHNTVVRRINKKYFFGFEYKKQGDFYFPVSDIEKTFIDMVYFNEHLDNEVIKEFNKRMSKKRLNSYLKKYPKKFRIKVLNYLK